MISSCLAQRSRSLRSVIKNGYNSHYVCVSSNGKISNFGHKGIQKTPVYDEIVIAQECQITPVYVIKVAKTGLADILNEFNAGAAPRNRQEVQLRSRKNKDKGRTPRGEAEETPTRKGSKLLAFKKLVATDAP